MKKILILLPFTFLKRDYERFGIEVLKKNFLDSCSNSMHDLEQRRKIIEDFKEEVDQFKK